MKALFLDRDGVVNVDKGYVYLVKDFEFMPGIFTLLRGAKERGYLLLLVTNQSGIGRGYYSLKDFEALNAYMQAKLQENLGFGLDKIYFCPHAPNQNCACRKPKVGMLEQALQDYPLDLAQSVLVGDKMSDIEFGLKGGIGINLLFSLQEPQAQGRIARLEQVLDFLTPQKGHFCTSPTP
ncbi:HAD family hydrolase [Helicobacter heilmannii]|uniref:D,D-heptose 1,7-bisphosphate phosphatase n=1 Tax=Helicobacter heilmannii TaxID=35817 RepID=A0A0K2Y4M8_HELHE|nr:HAD family hydrolase [Helicobacter heilmannii]BDQ27694.1 D-glycero-beta-D-manno-heptose-1,7-bisphosphate 7-phosphatase [Helicobacter heilmannii]CCM11159.1 D-glycero-D-manno-heptose 1,7-bisphosphate phosphatase [Helicobacter heilmannii ASB1.4]CRI33758.1 D-glycero-D-manno-heptose 1,7-bisphosphate phosphatase [Helicobacter heilmannii]